MITIRRISMPSTTGALIDIRNLSVLSGRLPPRVTGLVIGWASVHQQELFVDWDRAQDQHELLKIAPLGVVHSKKGVVGIPAVIIDNLCTFLYISAGQLFKESL